MAGRRFVIATDSGSITREGRNAITRLLEGKSWHVWHWFEDLWLIDGAPETATAGELMKEISPLLAGERMVIVFQVEGHLGGMSRVPDKAVEWLKKHWVTPAAPPTADAPPI